MEFINLKNNKHLNKDLLISVENNSDWTEILEWLKEQINIVGVNKLPDINLAYENDDLVGFFVISEKELIKEQLSYTPFLGIIMVFDNYRGKGYSKLMLNYITERIKILGYKELYLCTNHNNLYEKYGYNLIGNATYIWNETTKIYKKVY